MNEINANMLGARIREARERAGLNQGELSSLVALDRTAVSKIEAGTRKITALELSSIAQAIGVRMTSFFAEPLPALVSHRSSQGLDTVDSKIDQLLAGLAADVELVQSLASSELSPERLAETPYPRPLSNSAAEELAATARHLLGLNYTEPVHELANRVAAIGLFAFSSDLGVDTADAGTILLRTGGVSLVNSYNKVGKRRLALAHELGHFLVADDYTVDWRISEQSGDIESTLDRFARALLLPKDGLTGLWEAKYRTYGVRESAVICASEFRVDMATLARRLRELELIKSDVAAFIRTVSTTRADMVEFGLNVPTELEATSLPIPFQKGVLRLVREEKISRERALGLLQNTFDDDDLPPHRTRREDELWNFV